MTSSSDSGAPEPLSDRWPPVERFVTWLLAGALAVIPLYVATLGRFSRPIADDFCTAGWLQQFGFLGSQAYWYQHWSGRFSFSFLMTASQLAGFSLTPWMPAVHIAALIGALYWTSGQLARRFRWPIRRAERAFAVALVVAWTVAAAPNLYQSFLWHTGLMTYALSLIFGVLLVGWLARLGTSESGASFASRFLVPFSLAFVAGGLSETYVALQTGLLGLGLLIVVWPAARRRTLPPILAAILGSLLAAVVVWAAPGNDVRQGLLLSPSPWPQVLRDSVYHAYLFAAQVKSHQLGWVALALAASFLVYWRLPAQPRRGLEPADGPLNSTGLLLGVLVIFPFVVFVAIAGVMAPSAYALGSYPDGRVLLLAQFVLSFGVVLWGCLFGYLGSRLLRNPRQTGWRAWLAPVGRLLLLAPSVLLVLGFVRNTAPSAADMRQFAARWDDRDRSLRAPGAETSNGPIEAASLTHLGGLAELERDVDFWVNRCVAMAYNVPGVIAK